MDYTMQVHGEKIVYPIPNGLPELISDISREVLRSQPIKLYEFITNYLDAQVEVKAAARAAVGVLTETSDKSDYFLTFLVKRGLSLEEANHHAAKIQGGWRGHLIRKWIRENKEEIRAALLKRRAMQISPSTESLINEIGISLDDAIKCAVVIQAHYRGHLIRNKMQLYKEYILTKGYISYEEWRECFGTYSPPAVPATRSEEPIISEMSWQELTSYMRDELPVDFYRIGRESEEQIIVKVEAAEEEVEPQVVYETTVEEIESELVDTAIDERIELEPVDASIVEEVPLELVDSTVDVQPELDITEEEEGSPLQEDAEAVSFLEPETSGELTDYIEETAEEQVEGIVSETAPDLIVPEEENVPETDLQSPAVGDETVEKEGEQTTLKTRRRSTIKGPKHGKRQSTVSQKKLKVEEASTVPDVAEG